MCQGERGEMGTAEEYENAEGEEKGGEKKKAKNNIITRATTILAAAADGMANFP
jgi:hypothetical protein